MSKLQRVGDLEISQNLQAEKVEWAVQRIGWVLMAVFLMASLLGLFGNGPLSQAQAGQAGDPLYVRYRRFAHARTETMIEITMVWNGTGRPQVWISKVYLDRVKVIRVIPPPDSVHLENDRTVFVFQGSASAQPTIVTFFVAPETAGALETYVGLVDGPAVTLNQFVYP